jgi:hypothetical protein
MFECELALTSAKLALTRELNLHLGREELDLADLVEVEIERGPIAELLC